MFEYLGDRFKDAGYFLFTSFTSTLISLRPATRSLWRSASAAPTSPACTTFILQPNRSRRCIASCWARSTRSLRANVMVSPTWPMPRR
ncbi:hypothetical protein SPHINGO8AM_30428 [Sphingomonas sp. 8AM]|nr:hypothetical protein SPHINGO8AM_30428 [Sphingomonas sp. 8AM]